MTGLRVFFILFLLTAVSGPAVAQEAVPWNAPAYSSQFNYFQEHQTQDPESWTTLTPEKQKQELEAVMAASLERHHRIVDYYTEAMGKWNAGQLRGNMNTMEDRDIKAVSLWLGRGKGDALALKLSMLRGLTRKAERQGLDDTDFAALEPYLQPDAIAAMKSSLTADPVKKPEAYEKDKTGLKHGKSGSELGEFAGAGQSSLSAGKFSKFYDGNTADWNFKEPSSGVELAIQPRAAAPEPAKTQSGGNLKSAGIPPAPSSPAFAPAVNKSAALTSDAYGVTVYVSGSNSPLTFRKGAEAAAAIRRLPDGSVTKVIFYGHGMPGLQTVGPDYDLDCVSAAQLLKDKMAPGGVVQFSGCNTASIGDPSLNPLVGLSIVARRLLYFSLPYFQARADGVPAGQAGRQWEKAWNSDLAHDTSAYLRGAVVCGNRTFAVVPGRLPGVTWLMGNQEAVTPGDIVAKKACYRNGQEVPEP